MNNKKIIIKNNVIKNDLSNLNDILGSQELINLHILMVKENNYIDFQRWLERSFFQNLKEFLVKIFKTGEKKNEKNDI